MVAIVDYGGRNKTAGVPPRTTSRSAVLKPGRAVNGSAQSSARRGLLVVNGRPERGKCDNQFRGTHRFARPDFQVNNGAVNHHGCDGPERWPNTHPRSDSRECPVRRRRQSTSD